MMSATTLYRPKFLKPLHGCLNHYRQDGLASASSSGSNRILNNVLHQSKFWRLTKDGDPIGFALYRRHYSAKKNPRPKIRQFVGPGEKMVLLSHAGDAVFAWRKFIDDSGQRGVNCAVFRNEGSSRSSDMIREACSIAWTRWPNQRLYTYVAPAEIRSTNAGYCFLMAGWRKCGTTKKGFLILERLPARTCRQ